MARTSRKTAADKSVSSAVLSHRTYNAGGYCRLSVEDSGRPGADTIEAQEELIREYIESALDLRLVDVFCDNGRTGTNFERPSFERLMDGVKSGKIDCIVVKDLSRFGRNYLETGNYLERVFPFLDVRFIAVNDHFDTLTAERSSDGYIIPLKNIMNDVYSKDISRKVSSALATKRQNGEFLGSWAAYGYRKCEHDRHKIEPDEETAWVVKKIFDLRLSGLSYSMITRTLNAEEIPAPARYHYLKGDAKSERYANILWSVYTVKQILNNEVYLGHLVQGRKTSGFCDGRGQRFLPKSEWTIIRDSHAALISQETFDAVQEMEKKCHDAYYNRLGCHDKLGSSPNIFRGLLYCADCKRNLVRYKNVTNKGTNLYYVFICPSHSVDPQSCPKKYLHESELREVLWDVLQQEIRLSDDLSKLVQKYNRSQESRRKAEALDREALDTQKSLNRATKLYDSLYQSYVDGLMDEQEYTDLKQQYRAEKEQASIRLREIEGRKKQAESKVKKNTWLTAFSKFSGQSELTEDMVHTLIERVEVDAENHISIVLRYKDEYNALLSALNGAEMAVPE